MALSRLGMCCLVGLLASALAACAAPAPEPAAQPEAASVDPAAAVPPLPATTDKVPTPLDKLKPRTGGPLPPQVLPEPAKLDASCHSDADCTIKNVGNCCGYYPACVNVDSPTDPAGVQAQCAKQGTMSACGFQEIAACTCQQGQCMVQDAAGTVR